MDDAAADGGVQDAAEASGSEAELELEPGSRAKEGVIDPSTLVLVRSGAHRSIPLPGARLIREWNGRRYVVEVVKDGFVMDGMSYRSLTAIAFSITGARWSGPRFFGL